MGKDGFYHHPQEDMFRKFGVPLPTASTHGTEDSIRNSLERLVPNKWTLEGNMLIGETVEGHRIAQTIPTDYICRGSDAAGLPLLEKIVL